MSPSWEDLDAFLDPGDFAVWGVITRASGGTAAAAGIYDDPYLSVDAGGFEADASRPRFTCKAVDVAGVERGDTIVIGRQVFDILTDPQLDGTGMAVLELAAQEVL